MAQFERPKNTIDDAASFQVGDLLWHVYGIWRPQSHGPYTVTRVAGPFREHPEYEEIHVGHADHIVFDTRWPDSDLTTMRYATDGNLQPGYSHNDNYWFRTQEDAEAARDFLLAQWEASPEAMAREQMRLRREMDRMFDDHFYDDWREEDETQVAAQ